MKSVLDFKKKKIAGEKIAMITCYDYSSAKMLAETNVDCVLVGDSVAMVMHGYPNTLSATIEMMVMHTEAVAKGVTQFLIADMPFLSDRKSVSETMSAVEKLMRAGAQAIKTEGASDSHLLHMKHIIDSGIPVMGNIGFTMQSIHAIGGFKVIGKDTVSKNILIDQAKKLEDTGCFAMVLECVPPDLAKTISESLSIPTIGIGAGPHTDGQVLVFQDMLGLQTIFQPKFVKRFVEGKKILHDAVNQFVREVKTMDYPSGEFCY